MKFRRSLAAWLASVAFVSVGACASAALAQSLPTVSRPVVQRTASPESQRLNAALARIARDPRDFQALIEAGEAANTMGDPEAAAGFYNRADGISPNNPRIKAGLARALVLQGNPTKAIPLFALAEAGGSALDVTADRGLAYDLVGDPVTAQRYYRTALSRRDDDEVRRRLGVSLAIAGDAAGAEAMLMPLLRKQDKPGWRSHAFALAIEGKTKEAVDTVNAILPGILAQSVTPYLRYMPRLTRAQQAAAANLGKFPRASEIGRDDPAIAAYTPTAPRLASADAALIPQGKALGSGRARTQASEARPLTGAQRRAQERAARLARAEANPRVAPPEPRPAIDRDGELPPIGATSATLAASAPARTSTTPPLPSTATPTPTPTATRVASAAAVPSARTFPAPAPAPAEAPRQTFTPVSPARAATVRTGSIQLPASTLASSNPVPASTPAPAPAPASALAASTPALASAPVPVPAASTPALTSAPTRPVAVPGFDLGRLAASTPAAASETPPDPVPLEKIFADLGAPSATAVPVAGAVDIRSIARAQALPQRTPEVVRPDTPKADILEAGQAKAGKSKADAAKLAAEKAKADTSKAAGKKGVATRLADAEDAVADDAKAGAKDKKADARKADARKADAKKADAKKAAPSHPSRIWVQIGVGRDQSAIAFDWRRFVKTEPTLFKGRQASVSDMGRTNRILVGPFETQKAANAFVAQAKKAELGGAFVWTSPAGQVVDPLGAK
ncbi:tetratricopeptide (TPR) repeat protein [Novosphingobium chloroacetimidivorans]|uniref:Tetratricopeptide (TPR) repeat protein n=1 Tax=Novosphingobium chloroacetimidivorans TaxID=1428314 RepID=A0A7W7K923_9SPHN|nr:SPOR domain-containing protein [Novosphingobium chloroacetimidivorans]MBB4858475.1 tetratricopeptide (TPR) repeat protein [Novosphingobium chloroacetimidivorans]